LSVSIYYGTQSDIRVQSYCRLNLLRASVFNLEHLNILRDSIEHPSKKLLSFEFGTSFCFQFGMSRYITGLNRLSTYKVIVVWICYELPFSVSSIPIYYGTQSNIWVKGYCRLNFLRASVFNLERLDILRDSIRHPCNKLLLFEFTTSFHFEFGASRYITGLNRTSEYKDIIVWNWSELVFSILSFSIYDGTHLDIRVKIIVIWICYEFPFSIWSISIYYGTQSDIRVKSYCRLNLIQASVINLECLDILRDSIRHPSKNYCRLNLLRTSPFNLESLNILRDSIEHPRKKLLSFEFATIFRFQFGVPGYITGLNYTFE